MLTGVYWLRPSAVVAIYTLSVGDGLADLVGRNPKLRLGPLPWNISKVRFYCVSGSPQVRCIVIFGKGRSGAATAMAMALRNTLAAILVCRDFHDVRLRLVIAMRSQLS